jgi:hypothetical protein
MMVHLVNQPGPGLGLGDHSVPRCLLTPSRSPARGLGRRGRVSTVRVIMAVTVIDSVGQSQ